MRLAEGVAALRSDLPGSATSEVAVPLEAGDEQGTGISRFTSVQLVRERTAVVLQDVDGPFVVVGGDCGVSAAGLAVAGSRHPGMAVVWFDAHPDLNTPASSPSRAFSGMVLRTAIDGGDVTSDRVVLAGTRVWDDPEAEYIAEAGIRSLTVDELADPASLVEAVAATGADAVYVHVDLDVLDPSALAGLLDPAPFGLTASALVAAIKALRSRFPLAGATLASYAPNALGTEEAVDDGATILRIIAALD
jgi:arginase